MAHTTIFISGKNGNITVFSVLLIWQAVSYFHSYVLQNTFEMATLIWSLVSIFGCYGILSVSILDTFLFGDANLSCLLTLFRWCSYHPKLVILRFLHKMGGYWEIERQIVHVPLDTGLLKLAFHLSPDGASGASRNESPCHL